MTVGLVIVSHSAKLAEGVAELAGQMAPEVAVIAAGGANGGLGTDFDTVTAAITAAQDGSGVVVLFDLGSAQLVADLAAEAAAGDVRVVDAPLVEGAVAAAVAAQLGDDAGAVAVAAQGATAAQGGDRPDSVAAPVVPGGGALAADDGPESAVPAQGGGDVGGAAAVGRGRESESAAAEATTIQVLLTNAIGLHARPAATLARELTGVDATVTVRFGGSSADARSVLALLALGARGGDTVEVSASGPAAGAALARVRALAERDFDE